MKQQPSAQIQTSPSRKGLLLEEHLSNLKSHKEQFMAEFQEYNKPQININDILKEQQDDVETSAFEDARNTHAYFEDFMLIEQSGSALLLFGLVLTVIEYDLEYDERNYDIAQVLCYFILVSTIFSALLIVMRYQAKIDWYKSRNVFSSKENLISTGYWQGMLAEIMFTLVHPTPFTVHRRVQYSNKYMGIEDAYYHVNEILSIFLTFRVIFILRTIFMNSSWYNNRAQRVCQMYACENDYLFVIKCIMKTSPFSLVFGVMVMSIFWFGYMIRVCESPLNRLEGQQNYANYGNSMWNIIISMTTVGYGDFFPKTDAGRLIIFIVSIWGVTVVSIMVVTLTTTLTTSPLENKSILVLERLQLREDLRASAATVINNVIKLKQCDQKLRSNQQTSKKARDQLERQKSRYTISLKTSINEYKIIQRQYKAVTDDNFAEEMSRQFELMRSDFTMFFDKQKSLLNGMSDIMGKIGFSSDVCKQYRASFIEGQLRHGQVDLNEDKQYEKHLQHEEHARNMQLEAAGAAKSQAISQQVANLPKVKAFQEDGDANGANQGNQSINGGTANQSVLKPAEGLQEDNQTYALKKTGGGDTRLGVFLNTKSPAGANDAVNNSVQPSARTPKNEGTPKNVLMKAIITNGNAPANGARTNG